MTHNLSRGELVRAKVINLATNEEVPCMFNPYEYTLTKQNSWDARPTKGQNVPRATFTQGGKQVLKLMLHFDGLLDDTDVRDYTDALWRMMMVDESNRNAESGMSQPPEVAFEWGRLYFRAVLTNMSQKFTLFKPDGTPIRCQVDITLEQLIDENDYRDTPAVRPTLARLTRPGGGGENSSDADDLISAAQEVVDVVQGDRIDNIAANLASAGMQAIRRVMEENNINNPLNIPPGSQLSM